MLSGSLFDRQLTAVLIASVLAVSSPTLGEDTISIGRIGAAPGETAVVVPISARTSAALTGLNMDVAFDRALCDRIDHVEVRSAGRTSIQAEAGGVRCPEEGRISVVLFNPLGEDAVPEGQGLIAEVRFDLDDGAPFDSFPLSLLIRQARSGPETVAATTVDGALTVAPTCAGDCDGNLSVTVSELVLGVNVALGQSPVAVCGRIDGDRSGQVTVDELLKGVASSKQSCPIP